MLGLAKISNGKTTEDLGDFVTRGSFRLLLEVARGL